MSGEKTHHLGEWQLFTNRYGLRAPDNDVWPDKMPWAARHKAVRADANARPHHWCRCPGPSLSRVMCAQKATQEDGICDECREWCVCVDAAGNYHLLASAAADLPVGEG